MLIDIIAAGIDADTVMFELTINPVNDAPVFTLEDSLVLIEDDYELPKFKELRDSNTTSLSCYFSAVIPAFEKLKQEGRIDHWGITGLGQNEALLQAINFENNLAATGANTSLP